MAQNGTTGKAAGEDRGRASEQAGWVRRHPVWTTVILLAVVFLVERKPLLPSLLTSAAVLAVAYLIFVVMLGVPLPQGMLGIL